MSKFNTATTIKTTNHEGHATYSMTDKAKLITQVLTSFFNESKFYVQDDSDMIATLQNVIKSDPEFVSKLAVYARREFNMRTVSHVLAAYLAHKPSGKPYAKDTINGICLRGDDATEIMAFYLNTFGKPIPKSMKNGLDIVLHRFDEYTLAKYKGEGKAVKMRDVMRLVRPTPIDDAQSDLWKRLIEGKLEIPMTWETQLSANGNNKETWEKLIDSGKVGYMALIRNLNNILKAGPSNVEKVWETIENPVAVKKSKQLPFRYLSAYKQIQGICGSRGIDALESAVEASIENIPKLPGTTVIAVDVSGSMSCPVSSKSTVKCCEIGMMLGLIANRICDNSIFYTFDNVLEKHPMSRRTNILQTCVRNAMARGGTSMELPFEDMIKHHIKADRIIIISDNECNNPWSNRTTQTYADKYRNIVNPDLWVHAIDLQGYGTQQFNGAKTNIIAGWSEKVFNFILLAEQGVGTLEKTIAEYQW